MCDVAHVLLLEQVERQAVANQTTAAVMAAAGQEVEMVSVSDARDRFEATLSEALAPAEKISPRTAILRAALGLSRAG